MDGLISLTDVDTGTRPAFYGDAFPHQQRLIWQATDLTARSWDYMLLTVSLNYHWLSQVERAAIDRALWRSVEVLDEGYEG